MNMKKIMMLAITAVAAMAFAVPAVASATSTTIRYDQESQEALPNGTEVQAESTNTIIQTAAGTFECEEVLLHGLVRENGTQNMNIEITSGTATGGGAVGTDCGDSNPNISGITIQNITAGPIFFNANETATSAFQFGEDVHLVEPPITLPCHYAGNLSLTYTLGAQLGLVVEPSAMTPSAGCPAGTIEGEFSVTSGPDFLEVTSP